MGQAVAVHRLDDQAADGARDRHRIGRGEPASRRRRFAGGQPAPGRRARGAHAARAARRVGGRGQAARGRHPRARRRLLERAVHRQLHRRPGAAAHGRGHLGARTGHPHPARRRDDVRTGPDLDARGRVARSREPAPAVTRRRSAASRSRPARSRARCRARATRTVTVSGDPITLGLVSTGRIPLADAVKDGKLTVSPDRTRPGLRTRSTSTDHDRR